MVYSRHHDAWFISPLEVAVPTGVTSFAPSTWVWSAHNGYITGAPPNSACDYMNDTEFMTVGPPDRERQAARLLVGEDEPYPLDMDHDYESPLGVRDGGFVFRDLTCPTRGAGYYGLGVADVGPDALDHRMDAQRAWCDPDSRIDPTDGEHRFPTGTPCIPEGQSPLTDDGEPLSRYYNANVSVDATVTTDEQRCHPSELGYKAPDDTWQTVASLDQVPARAEYAWLTVPDTPGGYSAASADGGRQVNGARYTLEYSGDGPGVPLGPDREDMLRSTAYALIPAAGFGFQRGRRSEFMFYNSVHLLGNDDYGFFNLDIERQSIVPSLFGTDYEATLQTEEALAGLSSGYGGASVAGAPADVAWVSHHGPIRWFGAMIIGNGGCTLGPAPSAMPADGGDAEYDVIRNVLHPLDPQGD